VFAAQLMSVIAAFVRFQRAQRPIESLGAVASISAQYHKGTQMWEDDRWSSNYCNKTPHQLNPIPVFDQQCSSQPEYSIASNSVCIPKSVRLILAGGPVLAANVGAAIDVALVHIAITLGPLKQYQGQYIPNTGPSFLLLLCF
jgi:hypothetical protein